MVLLIDANIILDVLMNRREFVKDSSMIWKLYETEKAKGYVFARTRATELNWSDFKDAVQSGSAEVYGKSLVPYTRR